MNRLFGLFLMFWLTPAPAPAAASETAAAVALSPKVLRQMMQATPAPKPAAGTRTRPAGSIEGAIPLPTAIAFDANGCFAGYFPYSDLKQLKFDCVAGVDQFALAKVHPEAAKQAKGSLVVLELVPSFAGDLCQPCSTISAELREQLKSHSIDAKIFRVDIGY